MRWEGGARRIRGDVEEGESESSMPVVHLLLS